MGRDLLNKGIIVTMAGTGINLALGVLYSWSIFKNEIRQSIERAEINSFNWDISTINDPYATACLVFACTMMFAGKLQDKFGPRITASIGGFLVGLGFILISQTLSYYMWILGFGFLVGTGLAFGYAAATPAALKWFPPNKTGKISGIVVSGFGLASVYIAPLSSYLLTTYGLQTAMLILGISFFIIVTILSTFLVNPPSGYEPDGFECRRAKDDKNNQRRSNFIEIDETPSRLIRTSQFWLLWTIYFIGAGAGLMVIGSIAGIAKKGLGTKAFIAVAILAIGNATGRILAGVISDKIGRARTLSLVFIIQAILMFSTIYALESGSSIVLLVLLATLIGLNYGANLSLFPSFAKDLWGIKHFGANYGVLFTAWGIGGFVLSKVSEILQANSGNFSSSLITAGVLLIIGALLTVLIDDYKFSMRKIVRST